jgi:hypothetical protein
MGSRIPDRTKKTGLSDRKSDIIEISDRRSINKQLLKEIKRLKNSKIVIAIFKYDEDL